MAMFFMVGEALCWYQWMHTTCQLSNWKAFKDDILCELWTVPLLQCGSSLNKLQQTTTLLAYITEFEALSIRTPGLSAANLLNRFLAGLHDDILRELILLQPASVQAAMGMTKFIEQKLQTYVLMETWINHKPQDHRHLIKELTCSTTYTK
ncbi:hypothetical protein QQ045_024712 [Rhodiola kirilowii]